MDRFVSEKCPSCRVPLPSDAGFVICTGCRAPQFLGNLRSAFEIFGVPRTFKLDEAALETRYYELSKKLHPDRYSVAGVEARSKSQELSAALNQSYQALKNPESRLETLLKSVGALEGEARQTQAQAKEQIPAQLAEEFFEVQEAAMDATLEDDSAAAVKAVDTFATKLQARNNEMTRSLFDTASAVDWMGATGASSEAIRRILELRRERSYIRSMLDNLQGLRDKIQGTANL